MPQETMQQQETIPLTSTSGNSYGSTAENTATNSAITINPNTTDLNVYAHFFKQQFRQDFPMNNYDGSCSIGGSMNALKF